MIEYELRIKRGEQAASEILARGRSGRNVIDAIKAMRNASGITLREAKAHVDRMMFRQPAEAVRAAPEAVSEARIAGALFDFLGFLTTSEEQWKFSAYDDASPAVYALEQWADKRGFALEPCDVSGWRATTEAATQPVRAAPEAAAEQNENADRRALKAAPVVDVEAIMRLAEQYARACTLDERVTFEYMGTAAEEAAEKAMNAAREALRAALASPEGSQR